MAYKYSNPAELLYASYSGLQMMAFAFSKKKTRYSGSCYAFRETKFKRKTGGEKCGKFSLQTERISRMKYMTVAQAAKKWGVMVRSVQIHCEKGDVPGVGLEQFGHIRLAEKAEADRT